MRIQVVAGLVLLTLVLFLTVVRGYLETQFQSLMFILILVGVLLVFLGMSDNTKVVSNKEKVKK